MATIRLAPMSANTAIHSVACLEGAGAKNSALMPWASVLFCFSLYEVPRKSVMKRGSLRRLSSINAMSAVSITVSVPTAPSRFQRT